MTEWIKCSERLPNLHERVLVYTNLWKEVVICYLSDLHNVEWEDSECFPIPQVTHWMHLPKSPAQIEKEREEYQNSDYCRAITAHAERFLKMIPEVKIFKRDYDPS